MGREPNWWKKGYVAAKNKSKMSLPEDYFVDSGVAQTIISAAFNPFKESFEYALNWVETQQWKEEVGDKITPHLNKIESEQKKISAFKDRAMSWVDGYAYYMVEQYFLLWLSIPHELNPKQTDVIINQALGIPK